MTSNKKEPIGKLKFAYNSIKNLELKISKVESNNKYLKMYVGHKKDCEKLYDSYRKCGCGLDELLESEAK